MAKSIPFRAWFYFRQGWGMYFAFIFSAVNTMVTTYYLAIENLPPLKEIFPSFGLYLVIMSAVGIPLLVIAGYIHYKKAAAYASEADIVAESHPYYFRLPPGWTLEVQFPIYKLLIDMIAKVSQNEKLSEQEIKQIQEIQSKMDVLLKGGYIGNPKAKMT